MNLTPQRQALNTKVTAMQAQLHGTMHGNSAAVALHREVTALKNDIATGKNDFRLNDRMKKINNMIKADQNSPHIQPSAVAPQAGHYQPGHYERATYMGGGQFQPGHYEAGHFDPGIHGASPLPGRSGMQSTGPHFSGNQSNQMRYNMRQMSATLNVRPKF